MLLKNFSLTTQKLAHFTFGKEKFKVLALVLIMLISSAIPAIDGIILQRLTDSIEYYDDNIASDLLSVAFFWVVLYAIWWEGINILWRSYDYVYLKALPEIKAQIIDELYNYTQHHDHAFFQDHMAGDISSRVMEGARSFELIFAFVNEKILRKVCTLIFILATMYGVHHTIANTFLVWLVVFISISLYFSKPIHKLTVQYSKNRARLSGKIVDALANISAIRMFSSHKFERHHLRGQANSFAESDERMQYFMFKVRYLLGTSCSIMIGVIIYYIISLRSELQITIGQCVLVVTLCLAVVDDVWDLTQEFGDLFEHLGAFTQTLTLLENYQIRDAKDAKDIIFKEPKIEFQNVTFFYRDNDNIFHNKSIVIESGQKVGLAGFSGSGKTTFTNLITRLFDVDSGQILINGTDITTIKQESLRRNISLIPQEPILFNRSIMENIRYGNQNATDEEVIEAAKASYIHDFISLFPDGYNTLCGERGNNLSGGQKQRVIIARAILKNAPILILDEATSALDGHTESLIQKSLESLMENKTVLVIAHRLSTLLDMDRILVFENGHIVEDGSHEELKKKGVVYKKLWHSQIIS